MIHYSRVAFTLCLTLLVVGQRAEAQQPSKAAIAGVWAGVAGFTDFMIDLNTIQHTSSGEASILIEPDATKRTEQFVAKFDCHGHFSVFKTVELITKDSFSDVVEKIACNIGLTQDDFDLQQKQAGHPVPPDSHLPSHEGDNPATSTNWNYISTEQGGKKVYVTNSMAMPDERPGMKGASLIIVADDETWNDAFNDGKWFIIAFDCIRGHFQFAELVLRSITIPLIPGFNLEPIQKIICR